MRDLKVEPVAAMWGSPSLMNSPYGSLWAHGGEATFVEEDSLRIALWPDKNGSESAQRSGKQRYTWTCII